MAMVILTLSIDSYDKMKKQKIQNNCHNMSDSDFLIQMLSKFDTNILDVKEENISPPRKEVLLNVKETGEEVTKFNSIKSFEQNILSHFDGKHILADEYPCSCGLNFTELSAFVNHNVTCINATKNIEISEKTGIKRPKSPDATVEPRAKRQHLANFECLNCLQKFHTESTLSLHDCFKIKHNVPTNINKIHPPHNIKENNDPYKLNNDLLLQFHKYILPKSMQGTNTTPTIQREITENVNDPNNIINCSLITEKSLGNAASGLNTAVLAPESTTITNGSLDLSMSSKSKDSKSYTFHCHCGLIFNDLIDYQNHTTACMKNKTSPFVNSTLLEKTTSKRWVCNGEGRYVCDECSKSFTSVLSLRQHKDGMHSTHPKHICETCGKGYAWLSSFNYHKKKCILDLTNK